MNASKLYWLVALIAIGLYFVTGSGNLATLWGETGAGKIQIQQDEAAVIKAFEGGIKTKAEFDLVHAFVSESGKDAKWREIPWIPSLWGGTEVASQKKKPIFMWAMNGDPLGCV